MELSSSWTALILFLLIASGPPLVLWLALRLLPEAVSLVAERFARRRPAPDPSLQDVVADVRRLRREVRGGMASTQVRRVALLAAYDDALLDACRIASVPAPPLTDTVLGDRPFARLLIEAALEDAGILLDPPSST